MNFLEAHRTVATFAGGEDLSFLLAASGTLDPLKVYLQAHGARKGLAVRHRTLPFNTLAQWTFSADEEAPVEVALLFPWDLVPEADWRSGVPTSELELARIRDNAEAFAGRLRRRTGLQILYVPADLPPLFPDPQKDWELALWLTNLLRGLGARLLPPESFGLGGYLASGNPIAGSSMGPVAGAVIEAVTSRPALRKVLVTDLDHVMWHGVIGEDGAEGIECAPEGRGYRHFLYQTVLAKLEREGILIAAVSRNDEDLALAPFRAGRTVLKEAQLVAMLASYNAKSAQIASLAATLSLGLDAFVFVDDNPVELAEVSAQHPGVKCLQFPAHEDELPSFLRELCAQFARPLVTDEDRQRTELYRRRLKGLAPSTATGADLTDFLRGLAMRMTIRDRSAGDRARAVQLINKTNQFNLNGRRVSDDEVAEILASGGRLLTATLEDRNGSHGEILACLVSGDGVVQSLVMSCRVLQRRAEYAFLAWLSEISPPHAFAFERTERNMPLQNFVQHRAFSLADTGGPSSFSPQEFAADHAADLDLFAIVVEDSQLMGV